MVREVIRLVPSKFMACRDIEPCSYVNG